MTTDLLFGRRNARGWVSDDEKLKLGFLPVPIFIKQTSENVVHVTLQFESQLFVGGRYILDFRFFSLIIFCKNSIFSFSKRFRDLYII